GDIPSHQSETSPSLSEVQVLWPPIKRRGGLRIDVTLHRCVDAARHRARSRNSRDDTQFIMTQPLIARNRNSAYPDLGLGGAPARWSSLTGERVRRQVHPCAAAVAIAAVSPPREAACRPAPARPAPPPHGGAARRRSPDSARRRAAKTGTTAGRGTCRT